MYRFIINNNNNDNDNDNNNNINNDNDNDNDNNIIFSQGDSISYKYNCYQEKPCMKLKKLKKNCHT